MKKFALGFGILALSASAYAADISSGNSDLEGWAVEDSDLLNVSQQRVTKDAPVPFGTQDQYGGILFNESPAYSRASEAPGAPGVGDSYGSILHDTGFDW